MANAGRIEKENRIMSIFSRLALGTANFGKEYNGVKVSEDEQKRILDYCQCSGIDMIDTAVSYEWDWSNISTYFEVVTKGDGDDKFPRKPYGYLAHTGIIWERFWEKVLSLKTFKVGVSAYEPKDIPSCNEHKPDIIQVPYSIFDRRFESYFPVWELNEIEIHVRSIFLRGKILERFKPWECIAFCLSNPYIDRIIIGVDSYQQLKDNLRIFHRWESSGVEDENVLDPRKWGTTCYDNRGNIVSEKEK